MLVIVVKEDREKEQRVLLLWRASTKPKPTSQLKLECASKIQVLKNNRRKKRIFFIFVKVYLPDRIFSFVLHI
jgi:hypothetical protein